MALFESHPRIKVVDIAKGFNSNAALFRYARDKGAKRADMYEIALFRETVVKSGPNLFLYHKHTTGSSGNPCKMQ